MKARHFVVVILLLAWAVLGCLPAITLGQETDAEAIRRLFPEVSSSITESRLFKGWWWGYAQRAFPLGYLPEDARLRALAQHLEAPPTLGDNQSRQWVSIGPAPIQGGQVGSQAVTRPMSGRVTTIAVDPGDSDHWLIGGAQGGIWETRNAGKSWKPRTDDQASLAMGAIAFAPSNAAIVYAGTGEAHFSRDSYGGAGLLKSTNGGATWKLLAADTFQKTSFSAVRIHEKNPRVLMAATTGGLAGRGGMEPPKPPPTGVFKSVDGGVTWSRKLEGSATELQVNPRDFKQQVAGLGDVVSDIASGVYRSTDAGETWQKLSGPWSKTPKRVGRVELALAPSDPRVLYVSIADATSGGLLGLWRTSNLWAANPSWIKIPTGATDDGSGELGYCGWDVGFRDASKQCWYNHVLSVDPAEPNTLYAGGIALWKCQNCGRRPVWTEVSHQGKQQAKGIHVDQHALAWAGEFYERRLLVGNDGGMWSMVDRGATWADHNTNLALTQFYDGSLHPTDPDFALGAAQDNGSQKWTGGKGWPWVFYGDGGDNAISSSHPNTHWAVSAQELTIYRTKDGAATDPSLNGKADNGIDKHGAPFIARLEKCPARDNIFVAGTTRLWKTKNFFGGPPPSWLSDGPEMGAGISAIAFAPKDKTCGTYAFATAAGQLRVTQDGGVTWSDLDGNQTLPGRYVTEMVFDDTDSNVLYVTYSGFDEGTPTRPGHVFKTTNALSATPVWNNVSPPVNLPHNTIVVNPANPLEVYVGTDIGVWESKDGGATWTHAGPERGMPNVAVFDLQINPKTNRLVAFTHGRGAFARPVR